MIYFRITMLLLLAACFMSTGVSAQQAVGVFNADLNQEQLSTIVDQIEGDASLFLAVPSDELHQRFIEAGVPQGRFVLPDADDTDKQQIVLVKETKPTWLSKRRY